MNIHHGALVVATSAYTIKTLSIRADVFIAVTCGTKRLHKPGAAIDVCESHGVMISRGTQWDVTNDPKGSGQYQALALAFPDEMVREINAFDALARTLIVSTANTVGLDDELRLAIERTLPPEKMRPVSAELLHHRVKEVLLLLAQRGFRFAAMDEASWAEKVRRLVSQRPHAEWDVPNLAAAFHMSESTLRRRLQGCGVTLAALVKEVRMETALNLLQTTRLSIGEVAHHCGWQSHSRFTSAFQERWGVPPSIVRAKLKEDAQELTETD